MPTFGYQHMMPVPPPGAPAGAQAAAVHPPVAKSDVTCNTSKEMSMMLAHQNHTTEHTLFEMANVLLTPNGKFILDKVFERVSPLGFGYGAMPPPQQPAKGVSGVHGPAGPMLMMLTPQHQSVINYANMYGNEMSPLTEAVMPMFALPSNYAMLHPHQMCPPPPPSQEEDTKAAARRYDLQ